MKKILSKMKLREKAVYITVLLVSLFVFGNGISRVLASNTSFATSDIVVGKNVTRGDADYSDPLSASSGDRIRINLLVNNTGSETASGVSVKFDLSNANSPKGIITADNASQVSDTVNITPGGATLNYVAGSAKKYGPSCPSGCTVSDSIASSGLSLGDVTPGATNSYQLTIEADIAGDPPVTKVNLFKSGNIMDGGNRTTRIVNWEDPIAANPGEVVEFRILVENDGSEIAKNTVVKATFPLQYFLNIPATGSISSDNANMVSDTATVNVSGSQGQMLKYIPGHTILWGPGCPEGCSKDDSIISSGLAIGNVNPGANNSYQVTFKAYVGNYQPSPTATPTPTPTVTPTATPTPTVTPTPTSSPTGTPNSCGGTCGSNYNCQGGLYCYSGFCRNPSCPNDSSCGCATPTPTPPPVVLGATAPPVLPNTGSDIFQIVLGFLGMTGSGIYLFRKFKLV